MHLVVEDPENLGMIGTAKLKAMPLMTFIPISCSDGEKPPEGMTMI